MAKKSIVIFGVLGIAAAAAGVYISRRRSAVETGTSQARPVASAVDAARRMASDLRDEAFDKELADVVDHERVASH